MVASVDVLLLMLVLVIGSAYSSTIYVSNLNGNDSATCGLSTATACQSLRFTLENRVADNDTVELSVGEAFPIESEINVSTRNLTLRSAIERAQIFCDNNTSLTGPMMSFNASVEVFSVST
jgi:hypothetical protein